MEFIVIKTTLFAIYECRRQIILCVFFFFYKYNSINSITLWKASCILLTLIQMEGSINIAYLQI